MLDLDLNDEKAIRIYLLDLIFACPTGSAAEGCICQEIRKLPVKDRIKWVKEMSHTDRVNIYLEHKSCLAKLEGK